jgi:fibronectin-binding autotransporter adhesin
VLPGNVTNNAALVFTRSNAVTYAGVISGSGTVMQAGTGLLTLTGANTYAGGTTVAAGTWRAGSATSSTGTGTVDVNATAKLDGAGTATELVRLNDGATLQGGTGGADPMTNTLTLSGGLTVDGLNTIRVAVADATLGNGPADPAGSRLASVRSTGTPAGRPT